MSPLFRVTDNDRALVITRQRWIRRCHLFATPTYGHVTWRGRKFHIYLQDWRGPSYHVAKWGPDTYETASIAALRRCVPPGGVFVDVGANIGIHTLMVALDGEGRQVHAIEPEAHALHCLRANLDEHGLGEVTVAPVALSDREGEVTFYADVQNHGGGSLERRAIVEAGETVGAELTVPATTLDGYVAAQGLTRLDAVKLDVERHEYEVLRGASGVLENLRPVVFMECYFADLEGDRGLLSAFEGRGYTVYDPERGLWWEVGELLGSEELRGDGRRYRDLVGVPEERREKLGA